MKLLLISPLHKEEMAIAWIELESKTGNFVIQPGHAPMIIQLKPQSTSTCLLRSGKQKTFAISNGVAHITRDSVTLLLDA